MTGLFFGSLRNPEVPGLRAAYTYPLVSAPASPNAGGLRSGNPHRLLGASRAVTRAAGRRSGQQVVHCQDHDGVATAARAGIGTTHVLMLDRSPGSPRAWRP